jgi:hypothetical protein
MVFADGSAHNHEYATGMGRDHETSALVGRLMLWRLTATSKAKDRHVPTAGASALLASLQRPSTSPPGHGDVCQGGAGQCLSPGTCGNPALRHAVGARPYDGVEHCSIHPRPHLVRMLVDPELLQQEQGAVEAHGVTVAAWLRHAMRQVSLEDFPPSWCVGETAARSHDSGYSRGKFGLRLDEVTSRKLEALMQTFHRSAAEVIRQLIAQARPEDFPPSWRLAVQEGSPQRTPREDQP